MIALAFALLLQAAEPQPLELTVGDAKRAALVYAPTKPGDGPAPLVFGFHGHGGSSRNAARSFHFHTEWPEAVVVYMQGLPTTSKFDPDGKKPGWQNRKGDKGDRDLAFFDATLKAVKEKHAIDATRVYASGHSNGGGFTYLLWATRADVFAAFAPSAAGSGSLRTGAMTPKPVLHVAGEKDTTVPFENQKRTIDAVKTANGCADAGSEWAKGCTLFASQKGAPVVTMIHAGDHKYPAEAPARIVKFFRENARKP